MSISEKTAKEAAVFHLENATLANATNFIKTVKTIEKISGINIQIDPVVAEQNIQRMIQDDKQHNACDKIDDLFSWFEESTGQKPSLNLVNLTYSQTLGRIISYDEKLKKNGEFLEVWVWLREKYEMPSADVVQKIYLSNLFSSDRGQAENMNYVLQFSGVNPDIKKIVESGGGSVGEADIEKQLQLLSQKELINGNIDEVVLLEEIFGKQFAVSAENLQALYARVILENNAHSENILKFLLEKTGIAPSREIIKAKYHDLFARKFKPRDFKLFQDQFGIDFGEKDIINEQLNVLMVQGDWEHVISASDGIPGCRESVDELIKGHYEICRDQQKSIAEREKSIGILIGLEQKMAEADFSNGSDDDNEFEMPHFSDREKIKKELYSLITDGIDDRLVDDEANFKLDEFQQMAMEKIEKLVETGARTIVADYGKRGLFEVMAKKSSVSKISFMIEYLREGKHDPNLKLLNNLIDLEHLASGRVVGGSDWENEIKLAMAVVDKGFSVQEVKRFQFLVSRLVEKH